MPWCGWMTVSEPDWRLPIAIPRAEVSGPAVAEWSMDQPTTRRLKCVEHDCAADLGVSGWMLGAGRSPTIGPADGGRSSPRPDLVGYLAV